jgi:hypothetical protein
MPPGETPDVSRQRHLKRPNKPRTGIIFDNDNYRRLLGAGFEIEFSVNSVQSSYLSPYESEKPTFCHILTSDGWLAFKVLVLISS